MVIPMQHFLLSKESTQRDLAFELQIMLIESSVRVTHLSITRVNVRRLHTRTDIYAECDNNFSIQHSIPGQD